MVKLTRKNGVPLFCNILHFWRIWLSLTSSKYLRAPSSIYAFCLKISCSPPSSAFFLARDLLISVSVSLHMDSLDLLSILCLHSFLDCLPSVVRKFWSLPLIAWKYVKTRLLVKSLSAIGRWKGLFVPQIWMWFVTVSHGLSIPNMVMLLLHIWPSSQ